MSERKNLREIISLIQEFGEGFPSHFMFDVDVDWDSYLIIHIPGTKTRILTPEQTKIENSSVREVLVRPTDEQIAEYEKDSRQGNFRK